LHEAIARQLAVDEYGQAQQLQVRDHASFQPGFGPKRANRTADRQSVLGLDIVLLHQAFHHVVHVSLAKLGSQRDL
jgi:hypothetical protein